MGSIFPIVADLSGGTFNCLSYGFFYFYVYFYVYIYVVDSGEISVEFAQVSSSVIYLIFV